MCPSWGLLSSLLKAVRQHNNWILCWLTVSQWQMSSYDNLKVLDNHHPVILSCCSGISSPLQIKKQTTAAKLPVSILLQTGFWPETDPTLFFLRFRIIETCEDYTSFWKNLPLNLSVWFIFKDCEPQITKLNGCHSSPYKNSYCVTWLTTSLGFFTLTETSLCKGLNNSYPQIHVYHFNEKDNLRKQNTIFYGENCSVKVICINRSRNKGCLLQHTSHKSWWYSAEHLISPEEWSTGCS